MRTSKVNTKLSSYSYLFGKFDFNKTPLAPIRTKLVIHAKPNKRDYWSFHGEDSWYIGPAMDHYRCTTCYIPSIFKTRFMYTATLMSHNIPIPTSTLNRHEIPEAVEKDSTYVSLRTSEGEDTQHTIIPNNNTIVKHNIKTSPLQQQSTLNKQNKFNYKNKTTTDTQFDTLLK